jgi:hypothetical protein
MLLALLLAKYSAVLQVQYELGEPMRASKRSTFYINVSKQDLANFLVIYHSTLSEQ